MERMISTILMDIDDRLLDFDLCAKWAMDEAAKKMKLILPQNTYDHFKKINASLWKQMEKKEITSDEIYCVRWEKVSLAVGVSLDGKEFEKHFLAYLSKSAIQVEGALELLEYLSGKYKIYAASNGPFEQQVQRMKLAGMDNYLSGYFVSEKIGHSKPTKEFFAVCCKEICAADLSEIIMIGDSLSADIKGANNYGIKTCWFDKESKGTENPADYTVDHLLEIKAFL
ncbi:HAD family hydrolase [Mediterraneibacter massiliensis]|uniref:HAD family hydrolase n=1 Tax=Mediterraneibacter massiliensis TaxID=1720300 RepID=UPI0024ADF690|nr:HAD-IA family hydrolase [Mediterraneibacter massiliensis]